MFFSSSRFVNLYGACVFAASLACLGIAQNSDLVTLYQHAKAAESSGDYKSATADYEKIIQLRPEMAEAYANVGNLYYLQGETHKAETCFRKAVALKPSLPGPYFFLGVLSCNSRAYHEAFKFLKKAEELEPSNSLIQTYLGYTEFGLQNYSDAAVNLENAANAEPKNIDVFYHLSKAYANLAKVNFGDLEKRFPDSFSAFLAKAHLYEAQQNWDLALQNYQKAAARNPTYAPVQKKLSDIAIRKSGQSAQPELSGTDDGKADGALALFYRPPAGDKVLDILKTSQQQEHQLRSQSIQSAEGLYQLADGYQALSYLAGQWVFEVDPDSYRAHQIKGQYYEESNQDEQAIGEYKRVIEINPKLPNMHFAIGNLYWKREKLDDALPELQKQLESDPAHAQALYEVGDILIARNELTDSEAYLLKAVKYEPGMQEGHLALARIYGIKRQFEKAVIHLRRASEIDPKDPSPHYRLSKLYQEFGKTQQAQTELAVFAKLKQAH